MARAHSDYRVDLFYLDSRETDGFRKGALRFRAASDLEAIHEARSATALIPPLSALAFYRVTDSTTDNVIFDSSEGLQAFTRARPRAPTGAVLDREAGVRAASAAARWAAKRRR